MILFVSGVVKFIETEGSQVLGRGMTRELVFNGDRVSVQNDEKFLKMDSNGSCTIWMYLMPLNYIPKNGKLYAYVSVPSLSCVWLFVVPWTAPEGEETLRPPQSDLRSPGIISKHGGFRAPDGDSARIWEREWHGLWVIRGSKYFFPKPVCWIMAETE